MLARLAGTAGVRSVIAESALLKYQLLIVNRPSRRAVNLRVTDRFIGAVCCLFICRARLVRSAIILRPSTILNFHRNLVKLKYRLGGAKYFLPPMRQKKWPLRRNIVEHGWLGYNRHESLYRFKDGNHWIHEGFGERCCKRWYTANAVSSRLTNTLAIASREQSGWQPKRPALIPEIGRPSYFAA